MSKEQIEKRIRLIFYFVFGVIFSFLFIMSSVYIDFSRKINDRQKEQIQSLLVDGLRVREKYIYEEFLTKNYESIKVRTDEFFNKQFIEKYNLILLDVSGGCISGTNSNCDLVKQLAEKYSDGTEGFFAKESLGIFYIVYPVKGWGKDFGFYSVAIPLSEISEESTFSKTLFYYILPFLLLILLTFSVYRLTERMIIKPTIKRIIESEKIQTERELVRQFAHDVRSPIVTLETVLDVYSENFPEESKELISQALERITSVSEELLTKEKNRRVDCVEITDLLKSLENDKKLEYKNRNLMFRYDIPADLSIIYVNKINLNRALSNLMNNSIEANQGETISLKVTLRSLNENLVLSIEDNSGGVMEDKISLILNGDYSSKDDGNGLGVSSTVKWLKEIGGDFDMRSQLGIGTTVELRFPLGVTLG